MAQQAVPGALRSAPPGGADLDDRGCADRPDLDNRGLGDDVDSGTRYPSPPLVVDALTVVRY